MQLFLLLFFCYVLVHLMYTKHKSYCWLVSSLAVLLCSSSFDVHKTQIILLVGWCLTALSAQKAYIMPCKNSLTIPWRFAELLSSTRHVKCYSYHAHTSVTVSGGGRNATVHDPKPYT